MVDMDLPLNYMEMVHTHDEDMDLPWAAVQADSLL